MTTSWGCGKTFQIDNSLIRGETKTTQIPALIRCFRSLNFILKLTTGHYLVWKVVILSTSQSPLLVRQVEDLRLNQNAVNEPTGNPETTFEILDLSCKRNLRNSVSELGLLKAIGFTQIHLGGHNWFCLTFLFFLSFLKQGKNINYCLSFYFNI